MDPMMNQRPDDHEAAMARADLFKCAQYSFKLFKMIHDGQQLEGWVQAKVTKAADYIASVYHYMEYEMKFSEYGEQVENSDMYSESQKRAMQGMLLEAKAKVKELTKAQAAKLKKKESEVKESWDDMLKNVADQKDKTTGKFDKKKTSTGTQYTRKSNTFTDGGDDSDTKKAKKSGKVKEGFPTVDDAKKDAEKAKGTGKFDVKKTSTGTQYTRKSNTFTDGGDDSDTKKAKKAAKKTNEAAKPDFLDMDKDGDKKEPMKKAVADKKKAPFKKTNEAAKPDFLDMDKDGDKKEPMKKAVADKKAGPKKGVNPFAKKVEEAKDKEPEGTYSSKRQETDSQRIARLAKEKRQAEKAKQAEEKKVAEGKPSAGMSAGAKSSLVKKAKAGGDIGKPGKSFDKVAKAAGGGEKGTKIAAAAMWKNAAK